MERVWYGATPGARAARGLLTPLGWTFGAVAALRGRLYDRGLLRSVEGALPALGVGNLTVGGTGKTPVAAEIARRLLESGARPAIVLRGYGGDEPLVHSLLNPTIPVVAGADRVGGVQDAAAAGADVVVLDDAFQHRRLRRELDVVLVSADRWGGAPPRPLPAGPWRERLHALERASLALVTRKAASDSQVEGVLEAIRKAAPGCPVAVARLEMRALVTLGEGGSEQRPLEWLAGRRVVAAAAIGDPAAFLSQLSARGAKIVPHIWPDHHAFTHQDVRQLVVAAGPDPVVCTLKDAVKLAPFWPREGLPLWYVSQMVTFERGENELQRILTALLAARSHTNRHGL